MDEQEVPERFNSRAGASALPVRVATDFEVSAVGGGAMQPLHAMGGGGTPPQLVLSAQLVPPLEVGKPDAERVAVTTGPLVDWVPEQGAAGEVGALWVSTQAAWYKLLEPSPRYAPLFKATLEGAAPAKLEAKRKPQRRSGGAAAKRSAAAAAGGSSGAGKSKRAKASGGTSKVRFAAGGTASAAGSAADLASMFVVGAELDALSDGDMPEDFDVSDAEADKDTVRDPGKARRKAWQRLKYWQRRVAEEEQQRAEAEARAVVEAAADAQRGLPPEPQTGGFRVPPDCVADLLSVWEFTQAFGEILQLPPIPLPALEAAVCPGPLVPRAAGGAGRAQTTEGAAENADTAGASVASQGQQQQQQQQQQQEGPSPGTQLNSTAAGQEQEEPGQQQQQQGASPGEAQGPPVPQQQPVQAAGAAAGAALQQGPEGMDVDQGGSPQEGGPPPAGDQQPDQGQAAAAQPKEEPDAAAGDEAATEDAAQGQAGESQQAEQLQGEPEPELPALADSGRPRRSTAGNRLRLSSEDFIIDEPALVRPRSAPKQADEEGSAAQAAPLRFKVSLGSKASGGGGRGGRGRRTSDQESLQPPADPQAAEREQRLQHKYGLAAEAARRLVPLDKDYAASGVVLRDVCCALLRVASGRGPAAGEQPKAAKLQSEENENPLPWPERVCNAIYASPESDFEDRAAAIKLGYGDFQDLDPGERVRLLAALVRLALASEQVQAEINARLDAYAAARHSRDAGGAGDEDSDAEEGMPLLPLNAASAQATPAASVQLGASAGDGRPSRAGSEAPSASAASFPSDGLRQQQLAEAARGQQYTGPATSADWAAWLQQRRVGVRRPLGVDCRGRRYWCLGRQAGAFRIFVEDQEGQAWGWYEGEQIARLRSWLEQGAIACEAPLLRALRCAPLPRAGGRQQRLLGGSELEALRSDGYRNLVVPFLRGEWNTSKMGLTLPAEQRILLAVDAMLGAVPVWFQGAEALQQHLAICEAIQSSHAAEMGRALLSAEQLLAAAGRLSEEWLDLWQLPWSRAVASCGDLRDMLLYTAALQQHVQAAPDLLPRQAFLKYAIEAQCPLFFAFPGENVVVMRAGLLRHIDRYMQLLGLSPLGAQPQQGLGPVAWQGVQPPAEAGADSAARGPAADSSGVAQMDVDGLQQQQQQQGAAPVLLGVQSDAQTAASTEAGSQEEGGQGGDSMRSGQQPEQGALAALPVGLVQLAPRVQEDKQEAIRAHWEGLRQRAQAMRPVERYTVRSVVYRRHLADYAELEHSEADEAARRWPVAWLILRPAKYGPKHQLPTEDLAIPVAIDKACPEYVVKAESYAERMRVQWQPGDRFRMFFGGQVSRKTHKRVKTGGVWYKGTIVDVKQRQPAASAPLEERERYDPWESLVVQWEGKAGGGAETVSPWEVEIDPEEERRREEDARRQAQAAARAARARQSSRRAADDDGGAGGEDRAGQLAKMAARAQELLNYHKQAGVEEEMTFNEAVFGRPLQLQQHLVQPALPLAAAPVQHHFAAAAGANAPVQPLQPGQEVSQEVLDMLRPLGRDAFLTMLANFYRGLKGKFKIPIFAHSELDLYTVFWAVMERGGYETVTAGKQWKEICRCLPIDLTGQTSASFNMRGNYERCLLDFESYLACGQYERDLAAGCAPETEFLTDPARTRFTLPGVDYSTPAPTGRGAAKPSNSQGSDLLPERSKRATRGSSRLKKAAASAGQAGDADLLASIAAVFGTGAQPAGDAAGAAGALPLPPLPVLPIVDAAPGAALAGGDWSLPGMAGPPALPPGDVGPALKSMGLLCVGRRVERYWEEEGGWWRAEITEHNAETGEHKLLYNAGQADESFEWVDLAELSNAEIRDAATSAALPGLEGLPPLPLPPGFVPPPLPAPDENNGSDMAGALALFGMTAQPAGDGLEPAAPADGAAAAEGGLGLLAPGGFAALLADASGTLPEGQQEAQGEQQQQQQEGGQAGRQQQHEEQPLSVPQLEAMMAAAGALPPLPLPGEGGETGEQPKAAGSEAGPGGAAP